MNPFERHTAFERRRRRKPEHVLDHVRFVPPDDRTQRQLNVVESELLAQAHAIAPDAILFARFYERFGDRYGPPVRPGVLALVAALPSGDGLLDALREKVAAVIAATGAAIETERESSWLGDAFLAWSLPASGSLEELVTALAEFREQRAAYGVRWLVRVRLIDHVQPRAPRSLVSSVF